MHILVTRHGKTGRNKTSEDKRMSKGSAAEEKLKEKYDGVPDDDIEISKASREEGTPAQARFLAWQLDKLGIEPEDVYIVSGVARRHRQTRNIAVDGLAEHGYTIPPENIQEFYFLNEVDKGPIRDMNYKESSQAAREKIDFQTREEKKRKQPENMASMAYPFGESLVSAQDKVRDAVNGLVSHIEHDEQGKVLIFFGSAMMSQVITSVLTNDDSALEATYLGNNAVRHLQGTVEQLAVDPAGKLVAEQVRKPHAAFEDKGIIYGKKSNIMALEKQQQAAQQPELTV